MLVVAGLSPLGLLGWQPETRGVTGKLARTEQSATELRARTTVGQSLARLPRVVADPGARSSLDSGRADSRVLAILAILAQRGTVRVLDLPAVPGEDEAGQPRRQMLLAVSPDGVGALTQFFTVQDGPYRPAAATRTPAGLLVSYPPVAPPHLLDAFDGP